MAENTSTLISANEDQLVFAEEDIKPEEIKEKWKLLIVDDEQGVHIVTKMVLGKLVFDNKGIEFISAYSGKDAKRLIRENPEIAIIFMDVVMEEDDAGLQVIKYIREELKNNLVRIILRTGQPGQAPEEKVIIDYDINDYKEKTELTSQKLFTSVVASLRSYRELLALDTSKKGLGKVINSCSEIFTEQSKNKFASMVLNQLADIIDLNRDRQNPYISSFSMVENNQGFYISAAQGEYSSAEGKLVQDIVSGNILNSLYSVFQNKTSLYMEDSCIIYFGNKKDAECLIYFEGCGSINQLKRNLIEVFCSNISAISEAIISTARYESEKKQRILAERLRELNRNFTSTLELEEVMARLLESLAQIVPYDRGLGVAKKGDVFKLLAVEGEDTQYILGELEQEIISEIEQSKQPLIKSLPHEYQSGINEGKASNGMDSYLGLPVVYNNRLLGIVILISYSENTFNQKDSDLAVAFGSQAGVAIQNAWLFEEIMRRNADVDNILNNAGQGFLTFGQDMLVDNQHSYECISIFGRHIEGLRFPELIYDDIEQRSFLEVMLSKILSIQDDSIREIYLPLLPKEIEINDKYICLEFKVIDGTDETERKLFMVILTDITEKRDLENKILQEQKTLKMIVKAVTNHSNLVRCCKDYRKFCESGLYDILGNGGRMKDKLFEIQSSIHTFKGNFNQLDMTTIVKRLHNLETDIAEMKWKSGHLGIEDIRLFINGLNMSVWLDEDLSVLNEILGEQYLDCEKAIIVDQVKLLEIERKMSSILSTEQCGILLPEIRQLRYSPLRELMRHYPDYVLKLSRELGKSVYPLAIEGGDFLVEPEKLQDFLGTLVHVFRNALDHGIEKPIERISARKDECGTIKCSLKLKDQKIVIEISDDGRGIYTDDIKNIAVTKGFYDEETVSKLPDDQILALVFKEYFSTKENVNEFSGRGIGLAAVKTGLEKAGGFLKIETKAGMGTKFIFVLNYEK